MRLQKHEVLDWHLSAGRVSLQGVEQVETEAEGRCEVYGGRFFLGKVRKQRDVTVRSAVAVREGDTLIVYLPKYIQSTQDG